MKDFLWNEKKGTKNKSAIEEQQSSDVALIARDHQSASIIESSVAALFLPTACREEVGEEVGGTS